MISSLQTDGVGSLSRALRTVRFSVSWELHWFTELNTDYPNRSSIFRWGYKYSVFFDGNAFHGAVGSYSVLPPSLTTNTSGCSSFSTTIDGVVTELVNSTDAHGVKITDIVSGGFSLSHDADAKNITDGLSVLPSVEAPMLTYRAVADEQGGNSWTMSFSSNDRVVAELICITEHGFTGSCEVKTVKRTLRQSVVQVAEEEDNLLEFSTLTTKKESAHVLFIFETCIHAAEFCS